MDSSIHTLSQGMSAELRADEHFWAFLPRDQVGTGPPTSEYPLSTKLDPHGSHPGRGY